MNKSGKTDDAPMVMPWLFSKSFRRQHPENVQEIKTRLTKQYLTRNSPAFERQVRANIGHDTRGQLHRIQIPTLIMTGKDDELTPPGMVKELHSEIPNSRLLIFDQGGHGLYWEVPHLFNKAVLEFIS
ncbi:MAG: alpha/beta fold hydrolase [Deltaproteobacteria bacterium]|nr:alpha/beta fold hydrolase [Desulfobacteraceae bacterium]MBW2202906.1 alpha/beta fold hydrolase [Deltaproteobacteria bacterium]